MLHVWLLRQLFYYAQLVVAHADKRIRWEPKKADDSDAFSKVEYNHLNSPIIYVPMIYAVQ